MAIPGFIRAMIVKEVITRVVAFLLKIGVPNAIKGKVSPSVVVLAPATKPSKSILPPLNTGATVHDPITSIINSITK